MQRPTKKDVVNNLRGVVEFGYANGYHECGFDPVAEFMRIEEEENIRLREMIADVGKVFIEKLGGYTEDVDLELFADGHMDLVGYAKTLLGVK